MLFKLAEADMKLLEAVAIAELASVIMEESVDAVPVDTTASVAVADVESVKEDDEPDWPGQLSWMQFLVK
jgi:hypothetical protein